MAWLGLFAGIVVGAALGGFVGAIVGAFLGWVVGFILESNQNKRFADLERAVARLEARLAALEPRPAVVVAVAPPTPQPVSPSALGEGRGEGAVSPSALGEGRAEGPNPLIAWLTGGNTIARVGLLILFFGLAFLLKYAHDHTLLPVELRVASVALAGVVLLIAGWRLRDRKPGYALGMQGGGVAVLYLTTFAALRLYALIPAPMAFALLAAIAVLCAFLAVAQDSMILAAFGAGGGFLAPILASTGAGSHVTLFSYYLLLNAGILAVAWHKAWRPLNLTGFLFTFFIGLAWGVRYYRPAYFSTTEPFLAAYFLMYVAIAVLFARRSASPLGEGRGGGSHLIDGTIVFGVPLVAFGLQAALTRGMEFALAYSALAAAALYVALAWALHRTRRESYALLAQSFLALGVVFATVAIPLALDARWTSAGWGLEGAAIVWVGIRQRRKLARAFGLLLEIAAGIAYLDGYRRHPEALPLVNAPFVGALLLAAGGLFTYRLLANARDAVSAAERDLGSVAFAWGIAWWLFAGHHEIGIFLARPLATNVHVVFLSVTALAAALLAVRRGWIEAAWASRLLLPALLFFVVRQWNEAAHPFAQFGWLAWTLAIAAHFVCLRLLDPRDRQAIDEWLHAGGVLFVALLGAWELHWLAQTYTARHTAWSVGSVVVVPAVLVMLVWTSAAAACWPVAQHSDAYRLRAPTAIAAALAVWVLCANAIHDGRSDPLPYFPLLNALDLAHILAAIAAATAWLGMRREGLPEPLRGKGPAVVAGALAFIWLNGVLLRTIHHWADIPYRLVPMAGSVLVQAALSIFWSLLALALMVFATRRGERSLWMLGAGLMGVVVVKLFMVDLSHVGGIERIVSFIAVGVLMLVIGYFSPVPPRKRQAAP